MPRTAEGDALMPRTAEEAMSALEATCEYGPEKLLADALEDLLLRVRRLEQAADPSVPGADRDRQFERDAEEMTGGRHYRGRRGR